MKELGLQKLDLIERDNPIYEGVISEILSQGLAENSSNRIAQGGVHDWLKTLLQCRVAPIPHLSFPSNHNIINPQTRTPTANG